MYATQLELPVLCLVEGTELRSKQTVQALTYPPMACEDPSTLNESLST